MLISWINKQSLFPNNIIARAIENQCYVIAAAQFGVHNVKRKSFGHSLAVDPWGTIVADAGGYGSRRGNINDNNNEIVSSEEETTTRTMASDPMVENLLLSPRIVTCEIDHDLIEAVRERMPIQLHRDNADFSFWLYKLNWEEDGMV